MKKKHVAFLAGAALGAAGAGGVYYKKRLAKSVSGVGQTALVTGASSGIGYEFARIFAAHDFDLVITARSEDKLSALAEAIEADYDVAVTVLPADLSDEAGARQLFKAVQARDIHIDQLVNCAGAGKMGDVTDINPQTMQDLIHLNVTSVTMLSHYFGSEMKMQGAGKILNVASLGAFIPDPHFNVYGPTKAYELFLTEAMAGELAGSGVTVSCLCPGPTKTNWAHNAGKADSKSALDPADVARIGFEGMQNGELVIVPTPLFKAERFVMGLLPARARIAVIEKWQRGLIQANQ